MTHKKNAITGACKTQMTHKTNAKLDNKQYSYATNIVPNKICYQVMVLLFGLHFRVEHKQKQNEKLSLPWSWTQCLLGTGSVNCWDGIVPTLDRLASQ